MTKRDEETEIKGGTQQVMIQFACDNTSDQSVWN